MPRRKASSAKTTKKKATTKAKAKTKAKTKAKSKTKSKASRKKDEREQPETFVLAVDAYAKAVKKFHDRD